MRPSYAVPLQHAKIAKNHTNLIS